MLLSKLVFYYLWKSNATVTVSIFYVQSMIKKTKQNKNSPLQTLYMNGTVTYGDQSCFYSSV